MPSLSPKDLKVAEKLSKEYRIVFAGNLEPHEWPEPHRRVLEDVTELGQRRFSSYATEPDTTDDSPWKSEVKHLASTLVERAKRSNHRNESSWRMSCEPYVFARLSGDVVCKNCRKRVWRSEIEASCGSSRSGLALQKRQKTREPCRCPRVARSQDHLEAIGLNTIFGHREDEAVRHDPTIAKRLGKRIQKPDAIFGLRQTRNLENLLHDTWKGQIGETETRQLHEELQPSPIDQPLDQNGDELLYPFLVVEAKSGTSDCDWHSIQIQTAFPIRTFLEAQHRLRAASQLRKQSQTAPLVWFFANRGEDWRVSLAFMTEGTKKPNVVGDMDYVIIDVWRGSIVTLDGALQLLLLVDYVFDWARDIYREDILKKLRFLASGDNDAASTLYPDSDIFSTLQIEPAELHSSVTGIEDYQAYMSAQKPFVANDSELSVVRHATFVESRYCCVYVTRDNVRTMLQSTDPKITQKLCRMVLERMSDAMFLNQAAIEAMEEHWTGTARVTPGASVSETKFYTIISCTNYLSPSWHQVRELYAVAIADDAWDAVVESSKLKPKRGKANRPLLAEGVAVSNLLESLDRLQAGTPGDVTLACISRRAVELRLNNLFDFSSSTTSAAEVSSAIGGTMRKVIYAAASDGILRDIVHYLYISLKKGTLEPQESFLRVSKRFNQQHLRQVDIEPLWPYRHGDPETLEPSEDGCVLIHSEFHTPAAEKPSSNLCLYLINGDPILPPVQEIAERAKRTFETRDVYHTTQDNGTSNLGTLSHKTQRRPPWNLENTYGIYSNMYGLSRFSRLWCSTIGSPSRQGSPRISDGVDSGTYLCSRTLIPWSDPRFISSEPEARMFYIYKLMSQEISYWKELAATREAEGNLTCVWCAKVVDEADRELDICDECLVRSDKRKMFNWLRNCFMGWPAFAAVEDSGGKEEDELDVFHVTPLNVRGNKILGGYPALDQPFEDIAELLNQSFRFRKWARRRIVEEMSRGLGRASKRRKLEDGSDQHDDWSGSESTVADGSPASPWIDADATGDGWMGLNI